MNISLNIILDALDAYRLEIHPSVNTDQTFSRCLPLPDEAGQLRGDVVYAGLLSKALELNVSSAGACCLCLRDRIADEHESPHALSGLVVVNENMSLTALLSLAQNRFFTVLDWVQRLHESLIGGGTIQELVDMCAPIIDNYINVSDSSLMLLAHSRLIDCDDPICTAGAAHGYFPEEVIQLFRKYDLLKVWEAADAPFVDDTCEVAKYVVYHKIFKYSNTYFAHAVLTCNRNPLSPSMVDLFHIFLDVLEVHTRRAWEEKSSCNHIYDTFLADLIEGSITNRKMIEERAQYVGIPLTGRFCLFQIVPEDTANMAIGKMFTEFAELFPRFKFIRYQQRLVALHHFYARDIDEQLRDISRSMTAFLDKYNAQCGVSLFFSDLEDIPLAYRQSSLALKYSSRPRGAQLIPSAHPGERPDSRIYYFDQKYFYCLLGENPDNAELWYHSRYHDLLHKLYRHDQRHKGNGLQLLHTFLNCERNATVAANVLNMHRNNVTYHINRIQELLGINFDDAFVRLMTLVSYYMLELYGFSDA